MGNDAFLSLIHEARVRFLLHYGYSEMNVEGAGLIMADVAIEYKKELSYGDQVIISIIAAGFDKLGFDIFYKLELEDGEKRILAGKAKTGMMCFDYNLKKKMTVPANAIEKFTS